MTSMIDRPAEVAAPAPARPRARWLPASAGQALVWFAVVALVVGPFFPLVYSSLRSKPIYLPGGTFTLAAYRTLFADPLFWRAVRSTVSFALGATVLAVACGTALAILCARTNLPGRKAYRLLLIAPIIIPPLGLIIGWLAIYGQGGYLTQVVSKNLHLPVWNLSSIPGMSLLGAVITIPVVYLTVQAALAGTDSSLEDAARSAGAGPWRVITRVTLPMLRPAIVNCTLLIFALCLEILGIPLFLGAPSNIDFYASYLYRSWSSGANPDPAFVSAGAVLLLVVVSGLLILRARLSGSEQRFIAVGARGGGTYRPLDLGRWRWPASIGLGAYIGITCVIPLLGLALMSCVKALTTLEAPWHLFTAENWHLVSTDPTLRRSITNSLLIAGGGGAAHRPAGGGGHADRAPIRVRPAADPGPRLDLSARRTRSDPRHRLLLDLPHVHARSPGPQQPVGRTDRALRAEPDPGLRGHLSQPRADQR
jgi:iron(III) transport system permease protein